VAPQTGYFTDASMVRRVHREFAVRVAGPRTLLLQATHPVAFAGFFAHTGALDEPYERLARTAKVMDAITFGPRAEADRLTRRVRAMHRRVRGELAEPAGHFPAGTPYAADDVTELRWFALEELPPLREIAMAEPLERLLEWVGTAGARVQPGSDTAS